MIGGLDLRVVLSCTVAAVPNRAPGSVLIFGANDFGSDRSLEIVYFTTP